MTTYLKLAPALTQFLNHASIHLIENNLVFNLMDQLPLLKNGAAFASLTLINLFKLYIKINQLTQPNDMFIPDHLMMHCFGNIIPAESVFYPTYLNKISMTDATNRGIVPIAVNTFDAITIIDADFNPLLMHEEFLFDVVELNSQETFGDSPQLYIENNLIMKYYLIYVMALKIDESLWPK